MKKKLNKDGSYFYTPEFGWEDTKQKEYLVRRAWEAVRRNPEFRKDCQGLIQMDGEEHEITFTRFKEKWGVAVTDPDYSYEDVKNVSTTMKEAHGSVAAREKDKDSIPDIPMHLSELDNRLSGFSGDINRTVHCEEELGVISSIRDRMKETGQASFPSVDQWPNLLKGRWNPSRYAHLTIDIEAPIKDILKEVESTIKSLFVLRLFMGFTSPRDEKKRYHFDDDEENFKVYDLFEQDKTADEIIKLMWPEEYKRYGGRDTKIAEKGRLIQRAYNKRERITEWIKEYSNLIKHSIKI